MADYTENLNLEKPLQSEYYDVDIFNSNFDKIDEFVETLPKLYSNTGSNTDGSMTQKASTDSFAKKSGDTLTGLFVSEVEQDDINLPYTIRYTNVDFTNAPASSWYGGIEIQDVNSNRMGRFEYTQQANGSHFISITDKKNSNENVYSSVQVGFDANGTAFCTFPNSKRVDGQWTKKYQSFIDHTNLHHSNDTPIYKTIDVPNDGYIYEVLLSGEVETGSSSGNFVRLWIMTNILDTVYTFVCSARTRAANTVLSAGSVIVPVRYGANNLTIHRNDLYTGTGDLRMVAYRRVGTNA